MNNLKEFYLGQIESGWEQLEKKLAADRNGSVPLVFDYVASSLAIADVIGARREAIAVLSKKIKPHRKSLDEHLSVLEQEFDEKQQKLHELDHLLKKCGVIEKHSRRSGKIEPEGRFAKEKVGEPVLVLERSVEPPKPVVSRVLERAEQQEPRVPVLERVVPPKPRAPVLERRVETPRVESGRMYTFGEIAETDSRLTAAYINRVRSNKEHKLLAGTLGHVTRQGLSAWEKYFESHKHYDDLVQILKGAGVSPATIKKQHSRIKKFLSNIGGTTRGAIWTYSINDEQKIKDLFYGDKHVVFEPPSLDFVDRKVMSQLKITSYGLMRLKKEGLLRRTKDEYDHNDVRILESNLEEKRLLDDEVAYLCKEYRLQPEIAEEFVQVVYTKLERLNSGELMGYAIHRYGDKPVFIYSPLQCSPDILRNKFFEPLLRIFLDTRKK